MGQQEKNRHQRVGTSELGVYRSSGERSIVIPGIAAGEPAARFVVHHSAVGPSGSSATSLAESTYAVSAGNTDTRGDALADAFPFSLVVMVVSLPSQ